MAEKKPAAIWVKAKHRGQKPDMGWAEEGDVFKVEDDKFSKRWMEKTTAPKPVKADAED